MSGPGPGYDSDSESGADWADRIDTDKDPDSPMDPDAGREVPAGQEELEDVHERPPDPQETVPDRVQSFFDGHETDFAPSPSPEFIEVEFFDFSYRETYEELDRYWVNEPFAYVAILYDPATDNHRYQVVEPSMSEFETYVREDVMADLRDVLMHVEPGSEDRSGRLERELSSMLGRYVRKVDPGTLHKLRYYIERDLLGYDRIDPLVHDRYLEDISCDGTDVPVYVYHREYRDLETTISFGEERLNSLVARLAQRSGKHISVADPMVDASLPNGSRIQMTLGTEVSSRGSNFTIRQFSEVPLTPVDLINFGTFSVETMTYFWLAIENNLSLLFAGGTASGKTTSLNAISMFIPRNNKIISIEDTREITLPHDNWIQSVTREGRASGTGEIGMYKLLQAALRQRPEYLLVGEIRTEPQVALAFFQAMSTGHAAYTTMHADSTDTVLSRLQNPPLSVPEQMVRELDVVAIQQQLFVGDRRVRRNTGIAELARDETGSVEANDVYEWTPASDTIQAVNRSGKLRDIMYTNGWDEVRLREELTSRERLLEHMVEEDISDYESFQTVIWRYRNNPDDVIALLDDDNLDSILDNDD